MNVMSAVNFRENQKRTLFRVRARFNTAKASVVEHVSRDFLAA